MSELALAIAGEIELEESPMMRELTLDDLDRLNRVRGNEETKAPVPLTKRMSMRHHTLARFLSKGMPIYEACALTGYKPATVSVLQTDPAFQELMSFYRHREDEVASDVFKRLTGITVDAADELHRRLEETPEKMSDATLIEIVKVTADRTGFAPQIKSTTKVEVNVNMSDRLRAARERVINHETQKLIDVTPKESE